MSRDVYCRQEVGSSKTCILLKRAHQDSMGARFFYIYLPQKAVRKYVLPGIVKVLIPRNSECFDPERRNRCVFYKLHKAPPGIGLASLPMSISESLDSGMLGGALYMIIIFQ